MSDDDSLPIPLAPAASVAAPVAVERPVPLEEFLSALSRRDNRHELVNGFYSDERRARRFHDLIVNYDARYVAFQNAPA